MPYRFNVFTGTLDLVNSSGAASGVNGVAPSTNKGIPRWVGTGADTIDSSNAIIQDGGAVVAQGFISEDGVTNPVLVDVNQTWIAPDLTLETGGDITVNLGGTILIEG